LVSRQTNTVFAPATGSQRSAIGIVRVSGPNSIAVLEQLTRSRAPAHRLFTVKRLVHPISAELIDEAGVIVFRAPQSYTGEDLVEIHHHGSPSILRELLSVLAAQRDCRMADPGEFTKRAFLNGRMDLMAAEGVQALIAAETTRQARQAIAAASGKSAPVIRAWRQCILKALARLEAEIDFGEEEAIESGIDEGLACELSTVAAPMRRALVDAPLAERLRHGAKVVLSGPPNSGKSSLLNALADRDIAIVTDEPGTTRDLLEVDLELDGMAICVVDTAGHREPTCEAERIGIDRALRMRERADVVIELREDPADLGLVTGDRSISVLSKADLFQGDLRLIPAEATAVSSVTGQGIDRLLRRLADCLGDGVDRLSLVTVTNERQKAALSVAVAMLDEFLTGGGAALDVQCERLRIAAEALGRLTGRIDNEEILDEIFRSFCIGK